MIMVNGVFDVDQSTGYSNDRSVTEIHKTCFITFIATSECYMCMTYFLYKNGLRSTGKLSRTQETSLTLKRNLFVINVVSFFCAGYCFVRHNDRCEPGGK